MRSLNCDIEWKQNNDFIAIRPTETGRLKSLVKKTKAGHQRVWTFTDVIAHEDDDGDERMNHHTRGVVCGSFQQGKDFLKVCALLGLHVEDSRLFVPFSNGEQFDVCGMSGAEYLEEELKLMRWDLPTREDLMATLVKK